MARAARSGRWESAIGDRRFARGAVAALVRTKAEALGVPVKLALAIARFESGLRMSMRGAAGERGAMQVLPQTARQIGVTGNLYGPAGIEAGVRYLKLALVCTSRRAGAPSQAPIIPASGAARAAPAMAGWSRDGGTP